MQIEYIPELIKSKLIDAYESGEIASFIYGQEYLNLIQQISKTISCFEQGSSAELNRLKNYLGDTLPTNWESLRFNKNINK